jgi:hypothetical protein
MGGPFLRRQRRDDAVRPPLHCRGARAVATGDPAVKGGLPKVKVKPWLVAIGQG